MATCQINLLGEKSAFGVGFFDGSFAMYSAENQFIGQTNKLTKEPVKCLKFLNKYRLIAYFLTLICNFVKVF